VSNALRISEDLLNGTCIVRGVQELFAQRFAYSKVELELPGSDIRSVISPFRSIHRACSLQWHLQWRVWQL
jgi:hypothetical protein